MEQSRYSEIRVPRLQMQMKTPQQIEYVHIYKQIQTLKNLTLVRNKPCLIL